MENLVENDVNIRNELIKLKNKIWIVSVLHKNAHGDVLL